MPTIVKNYEGIHPPPGYKVIDADVMSNDRYLFTFRYAYCPIFKFDFNKMASELIRVRPSIRSMKVELWIDK